MRVDESLYFANARFLEDTIYDMVAKQTELKHVILHLSGVKGPVMGSLKDRDLLNHLSGEVFLSQHRAIKRLQVG